MGIYRCKKCGAEILFIKTPAGKNMPCDPAAATYWKDSNGKGRVVTPNGEVVSCSFDGNPDEATGIGYIPHWGTCSRPDEFRRKK